MQTETRTHYVPAFTRKNAQGQQETACRLFVPASQVVPSGVRPTCWGCAAWLDGEDDRPVRRRLTRHEQLQALADSGCDTWEEARGER